MHGLFRTKCWEVFNNDWDHHGLVPTNGRIYILHRYGSRQSIACSYSILHIHDYVLLHNYEFFLGKVISVTFVGNHHEDLLETAHLKVIGDSGNGTDNGERNQEEKGNCHEPHLLQNEAAGSRRRGRVRKFRVIK